MADISILLPDCDGDGDCDGNDGKRGKRGHRGHRGRRGPEGPEGPAGPAATASGGLLKFSGEVEASVDPDDTIISFLEDWGSGASAGLFISLAPSYPVAVAHNLRNMATNLLQGFIVPLGGSIVVELLQNGVPVPGFVITYADGESGVKTVVAGPVAFAIGDTFDLRVTTVGLAAVSVDMSATIGVE